MPAKGGVVVEDGRPSKTAFAMAALRALHYLSTEAPRILDDHLAMQFAGLASRAEVDRAVDYITGLFAKYGDRTLAEGTVQRMMMTTCARSRFVEDQFTASLARGMKQLIILGAGLDSTAYRCSHITEAVEIFEVDFPGTQKWKRERLGLIGISIPKNLTFIPFDFEHQTLGEALAVGGVRPDAISFFSWLGVQPYLDEETVVSVLDIIAKYPSGSELALDLRSSHEAGNSESMERGGRQLVASFGEPFKSEYQPDAFRALLEQRGFARIDMVSFPDWFDRQHARFRGRFSAAPGPTILVTAQVA
jgi:methyltransferase (TIGR00027 family)